MAEKHSEQLKREAETVDLAEQGQARQRMISTNPTLRSSSAALGGFKPGLSECGFRLEKLTLAAMGKNIRRS